jgi:uncharacterized Zn finger protein
MDYYGWNPYVPVAARRHQATRALANLRKQGRETSPVLIEGRKIATTFWGKAWCENLERYSDFENRLPRGRTYVRNGSVIDLQVSPGAVAALVSGSDIYETRVTVTAIPKARWRGICRDCSGSIDSLIELLQGRLCTSVMTRICEPKTGLFPAPKEISFQCTCPDWAWMCKHVAAVLYGVGARLDERPDLLFLLRGVDQQELIAHADAGLRPAGPTPQKGKVLDAGDLSEIFGIEIAQLDPRSARVVTRQEVGSRDARRTPRGNANDPGTAGMKAATSPRDVPTKQVGPKRASRATESSARRRAAIAARMRAYWRERRKRSRQKPG